MTDSKSSLFDVVILTKNNERTIGLTLESVVPLARRIVVVDSGSTDKTATICRQHGAEFIPHAWENVVKQRQFSVDQCRGAEWVLILDSDESLEPELQISIREALASVDDVVDGFAINRKIWFLNGWLHHVFQPEMRLRLVRGGKATVVGIGEGGGGGHDHLEVPGKVLDLPGDCRHDSWEDLSDMFYRYIQRAERAAAFHPRGGSLTKIFFDAPFTFIKLYVLKRGFRDGSRGLIVSAAFACSRCIKHLFIRTNRTEKFWAAEDSEASAN